MESQQLPEGSEAVADHRCQVAHVVNQQALHLHNRLWSAGSDNTQLWCMQGYANAGRVSRCKERRCRVAHVVNQQVMDLCNRLWSPGFDKTVLCRQTCRTTTVHLQGAGLCTNRQHGIRKSAVCAGYNGLALDKTCPIFASSAPCECQSYLPTVGMPVNKGHAG